MNSLESKGWSLLNKLGLTKDSTLLLMWLSLLFVLAPTRFILHRLGIDEGLFRDSLQYVISSIPLVAFFVFSSKEKIKELWPVYVIWILIYASIYLTYLFSPEIEYFLLRGDYGLNRVIRPDSAMYALLFFMLVRNSDELLRSLRLYAYIDFAYLFVFEIIPYLRDGGWIDYAPDGSKILFSYSLSFGYSMLMVTVILLYCYIANGRILDLIFGSFAFYEVFTNGNRGAFLLVCVFVFLITVQRAYYAEDKTYRNYLLLGLAINVAIFVVTKDSISILSVVVLDSFISNQQTKDIKKKFFFVIGSTLGLILLSIMFYQVILPFCYPSTAEEILANGISRNQAMLESGTFTSGNGREAIWSTVWNAIKDSSFMGYGFFGDRPFVFPHHYAAYSHNIALELTCSYGLVGTAIVVYYFFDAIRMFFFCKDQKWREIYLLFFVVSCQLLISYSFWYIYEVWAAFAISYTYRHFVVRKDTKKSEEA